MKISYKRFQEIVHAAEEQEEQALFLAEYGLPEWILSEVTDNEQRAVELITAVHTVTHMTPAELVKASGLSQTRFAARFMIPLRTVQNWVGGSRAMPMYTKFMIAQLLGLFGKIEITA